MALDRLPAPDVTHRVAALACVDEPRPVARATHGTWRRPVVLALLGVAALLGCVRNIPLPTITVVADDAVVVRGRYLAVTMGCRACHSPRDRALFSGPVVDGAEFTGNPRASVEDGFPASFSFGAPALLPGHLGTWSDGEIVRAAVLGQSRNGDALFPLMPYTDWREVIAVDDLAAVVAYLRTLPARSAAQMPERHFPMPGFVLAAIPEQRALRAKAPVPGDADYGRYVTIRSGCMGCHTNADARGRPTGAPFSGGRRFRLPPPATGEVFAKNLTPDVETGLGAWTKQAFVARFRAVTPEVAKGMPVVAGSPQTPMPWTEYATLSDEDLGAIYDFLQGLTPTKNATMPFSAPLTP